VPEFAAAVATFAGVLGVAPTSASATRATFVLEPPHADAKTTELELSADDGVTRGAIGGIHVSGAGNAFIDA
jgi:hypothetical protein